jgi:hypothetical protein
MPDVPLAIYRCPVVALLRLGTPPLFGVTA